MSRNLHGIEMNWNVLRLVAEIAMNQGQPINYGPIFDELDVEPGNYGASLAGKLLGEISTRMHQKGKPLITSLVVNKETGRPGLGFFELAVRLGHLKAGHP